jgi:hypothetical protein
MHPLLQAISHHGITEEIQVSRPSYYQREWKAEFKNILWVQSTKIMKCPFL